MQQTDEHDYPHFKLVPNKKSNFRKFDMNVGVDVNRLILRLTISGFLLANHNQLMEEMKSMIVCILFTQFDSNLTTKINYEYG